MSGTFRICATGLGMGIVHVLTGPDHLSALATLSANVGNCRAFWYGIRWGIGHSIGLVVVGSIFILLSRNNDDAIVIPESIETVLETFVGLFMIALGCYSLHKAAHTHHHLENNDNTRTHSSDLELPNQNREQYNDPQHDFALGGEASLSLADVQNHTRTKDEDGRKSMDHFSIRHTIMEFFHDSHEPTEEEEEGGLLSKRFLTLGIGIVHGVAGPGGVLGVIPAVQLHNAWLSTVYLGSFCLTSTLIMGCFAVTWGKCSSRVSQNSHTVKYRIEIFSASLSILVGCLWLLLLYLGILDDVFP